MGKKRKKARRGKAGGVVSREELREAFREAWADV